MREPPWPFSRIRHPRPSRQRQKGKEDDNSMLQCHSILRMAMLIFRDSSDLALLLEVMGVLNLTKLETARVDHRGVRCYGIVIGHQEGWSVV